MKRSISLPGTIVTTNEGKYEKIRDRKTRMGSMWKRIVGRKERDTNGAKTSSSSSRSMLWRKKHGKRDRNDSSNLEPEILRVSPMSTSCEVTLLSSYEDGPSGIHQITVTQNGKLPVDESYHVVLNPHRKQKRLFDDNEDDLHSSASSTHDLTTEFTPSAQSSSATCVDTNHYNGEETICFVSCDEQEQFIRDRHDIMIRKESLFYKSLFDVSESEDDDEAEEEIQFWEHASTPRFTADAWCNDERAQAHAKLLKQQEILNTTLDTALLEEDEDDEELTLNSHGFPLEIMVHI